MNIFKRLEVSEALKDLYIKYDGNLLVNNFGNIIDISANRFDSERVLIEGDFLISYLSNNEIKLKGKINNICIK